MRALTATSDRAEVWYAFAPLYRKLRLTARELLGFAAEFARFLATQLPGREAELRVDTQFSLAGDYLAELYAMNTDAARTRRFANDARFSRYVGVARFSLGEALVADAIYDTTDVARGRDAQALIALVPFTDVLRRDFARYARSLRPAPLVL